MKDDEQSKYRALCGQLNWIATQSRPDISFDFCQLSTRLNSATVGDFFYAKKVLRKVKLDEVDLKFIKLQPPMRLIGFCDASYANLSCGGSQGGNIVFLAGSRGKMCPISWGSRKLRRVCRSTIAAETMAVLDTIDVCVWLSFMINELLNQKLEKTIIKTDSKSLQQIVNSTTGVEEKRLRVEIAAIRENIERGNVQIDWVSTKGQLADVFTKKGVDNKSLLYVLKKGTLD